MSSLHLSDEQLSAFNNIHNLNETAMLFKSIPLYSNVCILSTYNFRFKTASKKAI